jgi:hypothetical protein
MKTLPLPPGHPEEFLESVNAARKVRAPLALNVLQ